MQRVLLVDDEDNLRRLLKAVLAKAGGFEVLEASNSSDGLTLAEAHHIDVLVTDVSLEGMDGPSLAHRLVQKNPSLLVVFISGYPLDIEAEQRRHPDCTFLLKPFPPKTLVSAIRELETKPPKSEL